ncbi:MAG: hypothetical protein R3F60_01075 [bacterium]
MSAKSGDLQKILEGPDDAALSADDRALLDLARQAFAELGKLVKNIQLYGFEHQANERFRARFAEAMHGLVARRPVIEVKIGAYELLLFQRTIYENESPERNFVYQFFMDGVRTLTFHAGLELTELDGLLDILLTDFSDPSLFEDDVVTLLWNKEFQHIGYAVAEDYGDDAREGEKHHYTIAGVLENVRRRADVQVEASQDTADARSRRKAQRLSDDIGLTEADLARFEEQPFAMDEEEFQRLKAVLHTTGRETLEKFVEILFRVNVEDGESGGDRVVGIFERIADLQLEGGNLSELERLMRKVRRLGSEDAPASRQAIARIFGRWGQADFVQRIGAILADRGSNQTPSALAILALLPPAALPHIVQLIGRIKVPERRQVLLALLPRLIRTPEQAEDVARILETADQGLAHELLKALRAFPDLRVLTSAVRAGMANTDAHVRLECLAAIPAEAATRFRDVLFKALRDTSKPVRGKAIHTLARIAAPDVHDFILDSIEDRAFAAYDLDEKRRFFVAAALTGDASRHLLEVFQQGRLIGRSRTLEEQRHSAAVALAVSMCAEAVPLFERELGRRLKSDIASEAAAWGLAHMRGDRDTRTRQLYDIFFRGELSGATDG